MFKLKLIFKTSCSRMSFNRTKYDTISSSLFASHGKGNIGRVLLLVHSPGKLQVCVAQLTLGGPIRMFASPNPIMLTTSKPKPSCPFTGYHSSLGWFAVQMSLSEFQKAQPKKCPQEVVLVVLYSTPSQSPALPYVYH